MMKCPKCNYERQPRDNQYVPATECPACGIVYAKSGSAASNGQGQQNAASLKTASPVEEESLKRARERVELRLRKKLETRVEDDRYTQTLERAKKITSASLKKKRSENTSEDDGEEHASFEHETPEPETVKSQDIHEHKDVEEPLEQTSAAESSEPHQAEGDPQGNTAPDLNPVDAVQEEQEVQASSVEPEEESQAEQSEEQPGEKEALIGAASQRKAPEVSVPHDYVAADSYLDQQFKRAGWFGRLLPVIAWLILLAGISGAVLSWTTLTDVQAGVFPAPAEGFRSLPIGLLLGFAYLATGVLGFAFFWVSSLISRQLREIRHLLLVFPLSFTDRLKAYSLGEDDEAA
jgi:Zn-finger nucleic acid-binding protein